MVFGKNDCQSFDEFESYTIFGDVSFDFRLIIKYNELEELRTDWVVLNDVKW